MLLNLGLNATEAGRAVTLGLERTESGHRITVTDDGPGFSPEAVASLGTPFFTTREGGTGLGLATSLRIVSDHGGTLVVDEAHRGGARVVVTLPAATGGA